MGREVWVGGWGCWVVVGWAGSGLLLGSLGLALAGRARAERVGSGLAGLEMACLLGQDGGPGSVSSHALSRPVCSGEAG